MIDPGEDVPGYILIILIIFFSILLTVELIPSSHSSLYFTITKFLTPVMILIFLIGIILNINRIWKKNKIIVAIWYLGLSVFLILLGLKHHNYIGRISYFSISIVLIILSVVSIIKELKL